MAKYPTQKSYEGLRWRPYNIYQCHKILPRNQKKQWIHDILSQFTQAMGEKSTNMTNPMTYLTKHIDFVINQFEYTCRINPINETYTTNLINGMDHFATDLNVRADYMLLKALWSINRCYVCCTRVCGNRFYSRKENRDMALKYVKTAIECMLEMLRIENPESSRYIPTSYLIPNVHNHLGIIMRQLVNLLPQMQSSRFFTLDELNDNIPTAPPHIQDKFGSMWIHIKEQAGRQLEQQERCRQPQPHR